MIGKLVGVACSLTLGNFIYAVVMSHRWEEAFERSFFQAAALLCAYLALKSTEQSKMT